MPHYDQNGWLCIGRYIGTTGWNWQSLNTMQQYKGD